MAYIKNLYQNRRSLYLNGNSTSESSVDKGLLFCLYSLNYFLITCSTLISKYFNNFLLIPEYFGSRISVK